MITYYGRVGFIQECEVDFTSENNPKGEIPDFILKQLKEGGVK